MFFWNRNKKKKEKSRATVLTDDNFQEVVLNSELPALVDFWAPWCGPCKIIGPIIDELAGEYKDRVVVGKVNVDQNPKLSQFFKVRSIPTLMFFKNQVLVQRSQGMIPKPNLEEMLDDLIVAHIERPQKPEAPATSNNSEINENNNIVDADLDKDAVDGEV